MPAPNLPKLCGADIELGNFVLGPERFRTTCYEAARAVLRRIEGISSGWAAPSWTENSARGWGASAWRPASQTSLDSYYDSGRSRSYRWSEYYQEWGRKFLPANGGCAYIDLDHLELCLPEVLSAWDHVAAWHAMLRIARRALEEANREQPPGRRICLLVNNSDGRGNSYGSHLNFLLTRHAWDSIFDRKLHHLLFLASYQVSSVILTGQGKVGAENGAPPARFQLSQRADFFEVLFGSQTTHRRPIVNSRDEPLCGFLPAAARLHVIFFDNTLSPMACLLKVGVMQILLAMLEAERVRPDLILDDPLEALACFSRDPALQARARMVTGAEYTALELQWRFLEEARRFADQGGCEGVVPRAAEILSHWEDTLGRLEKRDWDSLARRLDWVLKLLLVERALQQRPRLDWDAPEIKHLDHAYSDLAEGLYWSCEAGGLIEPVVGAAEIERFLCEPPEDTRAWTRAMLLRSAPEAVESVDWDRICFRVRGPHYWPHYRTIYLDNPLGWTRRTSQPAFSQGGKLTDVLDALAPGGQPPAAPASRATGGTAHETARSV